MTETKAPPLQSIPLRILATSDVHMHVMAFDYFSDAPAPGWGLEALAPLIKQLRHDALQESPPRATVLVDNGDLLQGTPLGRYLSRQTHPDMVHPLAQVMDNLGYDAVGLGNHDLDFGFRYLAQFARSLKAPVLSSNLVLAQPETWLASDTIVTRAGVQIGILSVLPQRSLEWAYARIGGAATIADMRETVRHQAQSLRDAGADLVLALAHTGIGNQDSENVLGEIAQDGHVDVLIGGHTHRRFPHEDHGRHPGVDLDNGLLNGCPTVMPGFGGSYLGLIDVTLEIAEGGAPHVHSEHCRLLPVAKPKDAPPAPELVPARAFHSATRASLSAPLGKTSVALSSYFVQATPSQVTHLVASAAWAAIDDVRKGTEYAELPLLSCVAPTRAGGRGGPAHYCDIPAGPLCARDLAQINIYSNLVWAVCMSGAEVTAWLERAAVAFHAVSEATTAGLLDLDVPPFDFDTLYGLTYEFDLSGPPRYSRQGHLIAPSAQRIRNLRHKGQPVSTEDRFLVAANSYRACGGGMYPGLSPQRPVLRPDLSADTVLREFVLSGRAVGWDGPWRFHDATKGTKTWIETGPGATAYLDDIAHLNPGVPEMQANGFLRVPITL